MIARNIIASFCIFAFLKNGKSFGKNLEPDTYGVKKVLDLALSVGGWGQYQV